MDMFHLSYSPSRSFPHALLINGFVTRITRRVPSVEQELLTLPEHLSSPPVFSGIPVTQSLVLCVCFVDRCLSFCTFSFGPCAVKPSSIYGFWLPLWYLLSDLLRYTDSDNPVGIFKLFLYLSCITKAKYCRRLRWKACSASQSIRRAIPLSFRRYFHVHISAFLLIRAYILILELAVINVIGLVSSDIALLTGNWTCLTGPPVRKSNISGRQPRLMTYNVVTSLPYRHLCIYCRQWCSTQDRFII
jgi:hypothetical protein